MNEAFKLLLLSQVSFMYNFQYLIGVRPDVITTLFCQEDDVTPPDIATFQRSLESKHKACIYVRLARSVLLCSLLVASVLDLHITMFTGGLRF